MSDTIPVNKKHKAINYEDLAYVKSYMDNKIEAGDNTLKDIILNLVYPVGSIYMSVRNVNPSTYLCGTWIPWGSGRVPIGVDSSNADYNDSEKIGGDDEHTLSQEELPEHSHYVSSSFNPGADCIGINKMEDGTINGNAHFVYNPDSEPGFFNKKFVEFKSVIPEDDSDVYPLRARNIMSDTIGQSFSVVQPYITCYMWKRIEDQ